MVFVTSVAAINLIDSYNYVEAEWAPKKPAYQLVDANGVLIGVIVADEKTGPVIHNNRVTVLAGGNAIEWKLTDSGDDGNITYKGVNCIEPWFLRNQEVYIYRWMNSMWIKSGDEFKIPSDMSTRSGDYSELVDETSSDGSSVRYCVGPSTSRGGNIQSSDRAWNIKKLETSVLPSRASLTWPLRVVPDKEVNGPLFFNVSYGITIYGNGRLKTNEERGSFCFSASEPYLFFDVIAKNSKGKTVKTWKNQRTGLWGNGCVSKYLENETIQSITKYKFALIYKGKVVAKLP
jgi:hypothetical protein